MAAGVSRQAVLLVHSTAVIRCHLNAGTTGHHPGAVSRPVANLRVQWCNGGPCLEGATPVRGDALRALLPQLEQVALRGICILLIATRYCGGHTLFKLRASVW